MREDVVIPAHSLEVRVHLQHAHFVGNPGETFDGLGRSDRRSHHDAESILCSDRQHRCLRGRAGRETIVHEQHGLAREDRRVRGVKSGLVIAQPLLLLFDNCLQVRPDHRVRANDILIEHGHAVLRQRADGKFTLPGMPDLANEEHVEGQTQSARHLRRDDHSAARQPQHQVGPDPLVLQATPQLQPGVFA